MKNLFPLRNGTLWFYYNDSKKALSSFYINKTRVLVFVVNLLIAYSGFATPFITTWKTDNPGTSNSTSITIPTIGGGYNYDVDWDNDGTFDEFSLTGDVTHDYGAAGTYTIRIQGTFPRIYFNNTGDRQKILSIEQWGSIAWTSMENAFFGAVNLTSNASDSPDLSGVSNMARMFRSASSFNADLSGWNVGNVTNMSYLFYSASTFNGDLSSWDVSNVTNMKGMFYFASVFNGDLSTWNVSNVINMSNMFVVASAFNSDISTWDVANVTNMSHMFYSAIAFNGDLSLWNVGSVTNMWSMFSYASVFNGELSAWNVINVINMSNMFLAASAFNSDISSWNVSNVTNMSGMFRSASAFNGDLSAWNVANVTDMSFMFYSANTFNRDLSSWNVGSVINMSTMFYSANAFNGDISTWNVGNVNNMYRMFMSAGTFNRNLSVWNVGNVVNMSEMFRAANKFNGDVSTWNVGSVTNMRFMFYSAHAFNGDISGWNVSSVTNMSQMFAFAIAFNRDISAWNVGNVVNMSQMFSSANTFNQDLGGWDISSVNNMSNMFSNSGLGVTNYDNTLIGWESQGISNLSLGATGLDYCNGEDARASLINTYGWTIVGDNKDCTLLPVELLSFTAGLLDNNYVKLDWQTASEINNAGYEIQRSLDGRTWKNVGFVKGEGSTDAHNEYEFIDRIPISGINYYRLKQIDFDGAYEYSNVETVNIDKNNKIHVYPNPTSGRIAITGVEINNANLKIINNAGRVVRTQMLTQQYIDISDLPSGLYFLSLNNGNQSIEVKVVKN